MFKQAHEIRVELVHGRKGMEKNVCVLDWYGSVIIRTTLANIGQLPDEILADLESLMTGARVGDGLVKHYDTSPYTEIDYVWARVEARTRWMHILQDKIGWPVTIRARDLYMWYKRTHVGRMSRTLPLPQSWPREEREYA